MQQELIVATGNKGKLLEIREILRDFPFVITGLSDHFNPPPQIQETGKTFLENARIKALWVFGRTGRMTLADDSGLMVDYLNGRPGVKSARFAGVRADDRANRRKLLRLLEKCPVPSRSARFCCAMVLCLSPGKTLTAEGLCEGSIALQESGDRGFGYDSLFLPQGYTATFAELDESEKNRISHRGRALAEIKRRLHEFIQS